LVFSAVARRWTAIERTRQREKLKLARAHPEAALARTQAFFRLAAQLFFMASDLFALFSSALSSFVVPPEARLKLESVSGSLEKE
jgi:hypothetical protein